MDPGDRQGSSPKLVHRICTDAEADVAEAAWGREKLKRHREDVAGRVRVPDKWSHEELLRDWMDFSSFNSLLAPKGIASARQALMSEGRRGGPQRMRIH